MKSVEDLKDSRYNGYIIALLAKNSTMPISYFSGDEYQNTVKLRGLGHIVKNQELILEQIEDPDDCYYYEGNVITPNFWADRTYGFCPDLENSMAKHEWNKRCCEYFELKTTLDRLAKLEREARYGQGGLQYQKGVVCRISRVKGTSKILKRLFEMIGKVAFVELDEDGGYVRFKDSKSASDAESFYSRCHVVQLNEQDCVGRFDGHKVDHYDCVKRGIDDGGITVRILRSKEERDYWKALEDYTDTTNLEYDQTEEYPYENDGANSYGAGFEHLNGYGRKSNIRGAHQSFENENVGEEDDLDDVNLGCKRVSSDLHGPSDKKLKDWA